MLLRKSAQVSAQQMARTEPFSGAGVQVFGQRVLTANLSNEACSVVADSDDVEQVFDGLVPLELLPEDAVGQVATQAWNSRRGESSHKVRIGDGAAWDDPPAGAPAHKDERG